MKYVFLFGGSQELQKQWMEVSEDVRNAQYQEVNKWFMEHASKLGAGNQLQPPNTATTVRLRQGSEPIVHDGPFIEGNEVIGGYVEVNVEDLDEALRMAKTWPGWGTVEIRPVVTGMQG